MSFTSGTFILFFAVVLAVYWLLPGRRWKNLFLLAASYLFYGWVNPWYVLLLAFSTAGDYFLALGMRAEIRAGQRAILPAAWY